MNLSVNNMQFYIYMQFYISEKGILKKNKIIVKYDPLFYKTNPKYRLGVKWTVFSRYVLRFWIQRKAVSIDSLNLDPTKEKFSLNMHGIWTKNIILLRKNKVNFIFNQSVLYAKRTIATRRKKTVTQVERKKEKLSSCVRWTRIKRKTLLFNINHWTCTIHEIKLVFPINSLSRI